MSYCRCHEYVDEVNGPFCFECSNGICEDCGDIDKIHKYIAFLEIRKRVYKDEKRPKILKFLSTIWDSSKNHVNQYDSYVKEKKIRKLERIQKNNEIEIANKIKVIRDSEFDSDSSCDIDSDSDSDSSVYSSIDDCFNDGFMIVCDDCETKNNNKLEYEKIKLENDNYKLENDNNNKLKYEKIKLENDNNKLEYEKIKLENDNNTLEYEKINFEIIKLKNDIIKIDIIKMILLLLLLLIFYSYLHYP